MVGVTLWAARVADAAALAELYNQGVRGGGATFETVERTPEERAAWLAAHDPHHPCLVATVPNGTGERVVGWAATGKYRSRDCYRGIAEFSVYVHEGWRGQHVGMALMAALIPAAESAGLWNSSRASSQRTGGVAPYAPGAGFAKSASTRSAHNWMASGRIASS